MFRAAALAMIGMMIAGMTGASASERKGPSDPVPASDWSAWISADDYPLSAANDGITGTTGFQLDITADGQVSNCTITGSSGSDALDEATCHVLQERGKFLPALDRRGKAVAGQFAKHIVWRLPNPDVYQAPDRLEARYSIAVDKDGKITSCKMLSDDKDGLLGNPPPCDDVQVGRFSFYIMDKDGNHIPGRLTYAVTREVTPD